MCELDRATACTGAGTCNNPECDCPFRCPESASSLSTSVTSTYTYILWLAGSLGRMPLDIFTFGCTMDSQTKARFVPCIFIKASHYVWPWSKGSKRKLPPSTVMEVYMHPFLQLVSSSYFLAQHVVELLLGFLPPWPLSQNCVQEAAVCTYRSISSKNN